jgi:hypothetical protein
MNDTKKALEKLLLNHAKLIAQCERLLKENCELIGEKFTQTVKLHRFLNSCDPQGVWRRN